MGMHSLADSLNAPSLKMGSIHNLNLLSKPLSVAQIGRGELSAGENN